MPSNPGLPRRPRSAADAENESLTERALIGRILFAMVWLPIQISVMLLFATGGIMLLLLLALLLAPFAGIAYLVYRLAMRRSRSRDPFTVPDRFLRDDA